MSLPECTGSVVNVRGWGAGVMRRDGCRRVVVGLGAAVLCVAGLNAQAAPPTGDRGRHGSVKVAFVSRVSVPTPFADRPACSSADPSASHDGALDDAEVEPHLSVSPRNPNHLVATWQQDRVVSPGGARSNLAAISRDGGRHWTVHTLPLLSACTGGDHDKASDPWTALAPDGTVYVASFALTPSPEADGDAVLQRLESGDTAWSAPMTIAEDDGTYWHEKPVIAADPHAPGRLYSVWGRHLLPDPSPQGIFTTLDVTIAFARSDDGGTTWTEPVALPTDLPGVMEWPHGGMLTLPPAEPGGGTRLLVVGAATASRLADVPGCLLYSTTSDDAGETWHDPVPIAAVTQEPPAADYEAVPARPIRSYTQCILTSSAVGPDATAYVVWFERTLSGTAPGGTEIRFARRDPEATAWETGVVATLPRLGFLPTVAVMPDGTVGVLYHDTRNDQAIDDELTTDLWLAVSSDRGATWSETHVAGPYDMRKAPDSGGYMLGDYQGLVAMRDGFGAMVALPGPIEMGGTVETRGKTDVFFVRIVVPRGR